MTAPAKRKSLEPWIPDEVEFYEHQLEGIRILLKMRSFLLADDMGLGKSIQALVVFAIDACRGWASTMLIVCPVTLKGNWADEIQKFTRFKFVVLEGTPKQRNLQFQEFLEMEGPKILVVNYEQVVAHQDQLNSVVFDAAVFDEAHYLKNHKAKRTKACLSVYSKRSFMLSGTPMLNHVNELWSILHRIDPAAYPNYWTFLRRYAVFGGFQNKQIVSVQNEKDLRERLQHVMLRRMKKDVLDLPDVQIIERRVDLYPEQRKLYMEAIDELRISMVGHDDPMDIQNALTKALRLRQICGTLKPFTGDDISAKLDLATLDDIEIIENGHRVVEFTQFRSVQACYVDRMRNFGMPIFELHGDVPQADRTRIVKEWSMTSDPGILVCMLQVAGVGLNMTAARHGAFLDKLFTPGGNQQAIDRLNRIGASTTQPIQIREYLCRNTWELRVNAINRTKSKLNADIVEVDHEYNRKVYEALREEFK